ncbi:MAG: hypothetical protein Q8W48_09085, partial [Candidatus Palauibacterales bacterium]|nr:hypothetical protein [Candidatus Palauibacterales bacterium]
DGDALAASLEQIQEPQSSELARRIWDALGRGESELDGLTANLGAAPEVVSAALLELELAGLVHKLPGPRFARALTDRRGR